MWTLIYTVFRKEIDFVCIVGVVRHMGVISGGLSIQCEDEVVIDCRDATSAVHLYPIHIDSRACNLK